MEDLTLEDQDSVDWLLKTLQQVQLEQFYVRIRDHLQITRISHFEYVTSQDLEKVGFSIRAALGYSKSRCKRSSAYRTI